MVLDSLIKGKVDLRLTFRQWMWLSCAFSCGLVVARVIATGYATYLFLVWNLFLACIPWLISSFFSSSIPVIANRWKRSLVLVVWILFIPNSFYIITDIFHLHQFDEAPKWFDLLLLFSFAWNGLLFGILSIRQMERIVTAISNRNISFLFIVVIMWLNAFGVYVGRYLRYNSWDIIVQPLSLFSEIFQVLFHPMHHKMQWGMISAWTIFMTLFYLTMKKLGESGSR